MDDIVALRNLGLSFEGIADQLNLPVGHVQKQWEKYLDQQKLAERVTNKCVQTIIQNQDLTSLMALQDHMTAYLVSEDRILISWQLSKPKKQLVEAYFDHPFDNYQQVLRIYDVTCIIFNGNNAHHVHEICIQSEQHYWAVVGLKANRCYLFELGIKISDSRFFPLLQSNAIHMPRDCKVRDSNLNQEIKEFQHRQNRPPNWIEHVSTYSFYDKGARG